jgi:hypothetical protein
MIDRRECIWSDCDVWSVDVSKRCQHARGDALTRVVLLDLVPVSHLLLRLPTLTATCRRAAIPSSMTIDLCLPVYQRDRWNRRSVGFLGLWLSMTVFKVWASQASEFASAAHRPTLSVAPSRRQWPSRASPPDGQGVSRWRGGAHFLPFATKPGLFERAPQAEPAQQTL